MAKAIERSLKKDPEARFASMAEFKSALEGVAVPNQKSKMPMLVVGLASFLLGGIGLWLCIGFLTPEKTPGSTYHFEVPAKIIDPVVVTSLPRSLDQGSHSDDAKIDANEEFIVLSLRRNPKLEDLALNKFWLSSHALRTLSKAENLKGLHLGDSHIKDDAGEYISKIATLKTLDVARTNVGDAFVEKISVLPKLDDLSLGDTKVTARGLEALTKTPSLRVLSIRTCDKIDDSAGAILKRMPWLIDRRREK